MKASIQKAQRIVCDYIFRTQSTKDTTAFRLLEVQRHTRAVMGGWLGSTWVVIDGAKRKRITENHTEKDDVALKMFFTPKGGKWYQTELPPLIPLGQGRYLQEL